MAEEPGASLQLLLELYDLSPRGQEVAERDYVVAVFPGISDVLASSIVIGFPVRQLLVELDSSEVVECSRVIRNIPLPACWSVVVSVLGEPVEPISEFNAPLDVVDRELRTIMGPDVVRSVDQAAY